VLFLVMKIVSLRGGGALAGAGCGNGPTPMRWLQIGSDRRSL
jgi:hypothetical protein